MRPRRPPHPPPRGPLLPAGGLLHRPGPPGRARARHARPFRPRHRRPRRRPRHARDPRHHGDPPRRRLRRRHAGRGLRRAASRIDGVTVTFHPAGHVLGSAQIAVAAPGLRIVAAGDYKRTPDADLRRLRAGPLRRLHHRGDLRAAGLPPPAAGGGDRQAAALARAVPRPHPPRRRLRPRQGAAADPRSCAHAGYDAPIYLHGALRRLCDYYVAAGHRPRRAPRRHPRPRPRAATSPARSCSGRPRPSKAPGSAASPTR